MEENKYFFQTDDMIYSLKIEKAVMNKILLLCKGSDKIETGSILLGYYTPKHDIAVVTDISSPPPDSQRGHTSFVRGVKGLQKWLHHMWVRQRRFYLGEWHFHPFNDPAPSSTDIDQLKKFSETPSLRCPEPIMVIVGGDPNNMWTLRVYIALRGLPVREMVASKNIIPEINRKMVN